MSRRTSLFALAASLVTLPLALAARMGSGPARQKPLGSQRPVLPASGAVRSRLVPMPLTFEPNVGQAVGDARFLSRAPGFTLALSPTEAVLSVIHHGVADAADGHPGCKKTHGSRAIFRADTETRRGAERRAGPTARDAALNPGHLDTRTPERPTPNAQRPTPTKVRMRLLGGNPRARLAGVERQPGIVNYLIGNDRTKWRTHIPTYQQVKYHGVYPGVDLVYHGSQGSLEYDFEVAPHADPDGIRLSIEGADDVELASTGDLLLHTPAGTLTQHKPIAYQLIQGVKHLVPAEFDLTRTPAHQGSHRATDPSGGRLPSRHQSERWDHTPTSVAFRLASYDRSRPLIIDPTLGFSSYLGGTGDDTTQGVAVGSDGAIYVTGLSSASDFTALAPPGPGSAPAVPFVAKMAGDGGSLAYVTYFAGTSASSWPNGIAVNGSGCAHVVGSTQDADFPTSADAAQSVLDGGMDGFATVLTPDGSGIAYSTLLGGAGAESAAAIALDPADGSAYVGGWTTSETGTWSMISDGAADVTYAGGFDGFLVKLASNGAPAYGTYLGGPGQELGTAVGVGPDGAAYLAGNTDSWEGLATPNALYISYKGANDGFLARVEPGGASLGYVTYLPGTGTENVRGMAVDAVGAVYVTGATTSNDFPEVNAAYSYPGTTPFDVNGFALKVAPGGGSLTYSTLLGGADTDQAYAVAARPDGVACFVGFSSSNNFPLIAEVDATPENGDMFATAFSAAGVPIFSTFLGGMYSDIATGAAWTPEGDLVVAGQTYSPDFPTTDGVADRTMDLGASEGFVARLTLPPPGPSNLQVTESADGLPLLSWVYSGSRTAFEIERSRGTDGFERLTLSAGSETTFEDIYAEPGRSYNYRVRAMLGPDHTAPSNAVTYSPAAPHAPDHLTAGMDASGTAALLHWRDNSVNEQGFEIEVRAGTDSGGILARVPPGTTSFADTDAAELPVLLSYRVRAHNEGGTSAWSDLVLSAPAPPFALTATVRSSSRINLNWQSNARNATALELQVSRNGGSFEPLTTLDPLTTGYDDSDLAPSTTYAYRIRSVFAARWGTSVSDWAGPAGAATAGIGAPAAPNNLRAFSPDRGRVQLAWMDNSMDEAGFRVFRRTGTSAFGLLASLPADATSYTDATTTGDTTYGYTVVAYNDRGPSPAGSERSVTTLWGPEQLTATPVTTGQINLSWKDYSLFEDGYSIERQKGGGGMVEVARVGGKVGKNQTLTYSDTGLTSGVVYTYRVRAYNAGATSLYATTPSATTTGAPQPSLSVTPQHKSYGRVPKGRARTANFTVKNAGKKWEAVTVAGLGGAFEVLGSRHFTLSAGASRSFKVRFTAGRVGLYQTELPVKSLRGEVVRLKLEGRSVRGS